MSTGNTKKKAKKESKTTQGSLDTYSGLSDTAKQDYLNYIESLTQLQGLQEGMGGAQSTYDEALADYQRLEDQRTDVLNAKNESMFIDKVDQFGNVTGRQTRGYEIGFGADYNPNRAMEQFDRMVESADKRIDYGVERRGEYRYTDADYQKMLDNMKAFGSESQYDEMVDKLKGLDREFEDLRFAEAYDAAQAQYAPELTAAASQVQAMKDKYGESSAEAKAAYDAYVESYNTLKEFGDGSYADRYHGQLQEEQELAELGGNTGMGFNLMDQEQINSMSSEELSNYLEDLMEYYG